MDEKPKIWTCKDYQGLSEAQIMQLERVKNDPNRGTLSDIVMLAQMRYHNEYSTTRLK